MTALFSPGRASRQLRAILSRSQFGTAAWRPGRWSGRRRRRRGRQYLGGRRHGRRRADQRSAAWRHGRRTLAGTFSAARQHWSAAPASATRRALGLPCRRLQRRSTQASHLRRFIRRAGGAQPDRFGRSPAALAARERGLSARALRGRWSTPIAPCSTATRNGQPVRKRELHRDESRRRVAWRSPRAPASGSSATSWTACSVSAWSRWRVPHGHERAPGAEGDPPRRARAPGRFQPCLRAGGRSAPAGGSERSSPRRCRALAIGTRIAMIDGGVASHPVAGPRQHRAARLCRAPQPTGHGTAVGSLLVGDQGPFRGAARGAQLFVGDVYGGNPAAGSATSIVRALGWAASKNPSVINISLVGPQQQRARPRHRRRCARAASRSSPRSATTAPPHRRNIRHPMPAWSAVTGGRCAAAARSAEAGQGARTSISPHPARTWSPHCPARAMRSVRGTSFAAPFAAARLAITGSYQRLALRSAARARARSGAESSAPIAGSTPRPFAASRAPFPTQG